MGEAKAGAGVSETEARAIAQLERLADLVGDLKDLAAELTDIVAELTRRAEKVERGLKRKPRAVGVKDGQTRT